MSEQWPGMAAPASGVEPTQEPAGSRGRSGQILSPRQTDLKRISAGELAGFGVDLWWFSSPTWRGNAGATWPTRGHGVWTAFWRLFRRFRLKNYRVTLRWKTCPASTFSSDLPLPETTAAAQALAITGEQPVGYHRPGSAFRPGGTRRFGMTSKNKFFFLSLPCYCRRLTDYFAR